MNYRHSKGDIESLVEHSEAKLVIAADNFADLVSGCSPEFGLLMAGDGQGNLGDYAAALDFDAPLPDFPRPNGAEICQICYTTGSTGNPKGAIWRHSAVLSVLGFSQLDLKLNEDDVFLSLSSGSGRAVDPVYMERLAGFYQCDHACFRTGAGAGSDPKVQLHQCVVHSHDDYRRLRGIRQETA